MASDASFVAFVVEQARNAGRVESRKMFGEYAVYCDGKVVMLVCDNRCFLKPTAATADRVRECPHEPPYPGAKPQPVLDELLDDAAVIAELVRDTAAALPAPRPKAPKKRGGSR
jgi:TfoX/Sxy family transcriptional regulator of competence genes